MLTILKNIAKPLIPDDLWRALRRRYRAPKTYWTWRGACRAAGQYDSHMLNRFRIARRQTAVELIAADHPLAVAAGEFPAGAAIEVTDFGGATGEAMLAFLQKWPNARCTVVETPGLISLIGDSSAITFASTMPKSCDIFYSSGTLQYLPEPYKLLADAFASARRFVVLDRNSFSNRTIIRVQTGRLYDNGRGPIPSGFEDTTITYPHRTIVEASVLALAKAAGFEVVHATKNDSGVQQYLGLVYGKSLVFRRK